jgi:hypothetical protein
MLKAMRILALCCIGAFGALVFASCGDGSGSRTSYPDAATGSVTLHGLQPEATPDPVASEPTPEPLIIGEPRPPTLHATSIEALLKAYPFVVVGEISGVIAPYDPRPGVAGLPDAPTVLPTLKSGATIDPAALLRPPGRLWTDYSLTVVEVLTGDVRVGDLLTYSQGGGIWEGRAHQVANDPAVREGQRYLFFLEYSAAEDSYTGMPFARFEIGQDGSLHVSDEIWRYLPAVEGLHDKQLQQARALIATAETTQ